MSDQIYNHLPYLEFQEMLNLSGKTAVVTGGGKGIGLGISRRLAEAGANIVMGSTSPGQTNEIIRDGYPAVYIPCDVSVYSDIEHLCAEAEERFGSIDIYVNNAGIYPLMPIHDVTEAFWDRMYQVNVRAMFYGAQLASKRMIHYGIEGSIVNVASICGHRPMNHHVTYDSTKGAVLSMTRSLAKDLGPYGIRVNSISPGLTATPGNLDPELLQEHERMGTLEHIALKRRGEPFEIASAVLFLASPMASYVTGTDLLVDGGWATTL